MAALAKKTITPIRVETAEERELRVFQEQIDRYLEERRQIALSRFKEKRAVIRQMKQEREEIVISVKDILSYFCITVGFIILFVCYIRISSCFSSLGGHGCNASSDFQWVMNTIINFIKTNV